MLFFFLLLKKTQFKHVHAKGERIRVEVIELHYKNPTYCWYQIAMFCCRPSNGGKYCLGERKRYRICNTDVRALSVLIMPTSFCSVLERVYYMIIKNQQ